MDTTNRRGRPQGRGSGDEVVALRDVIAARVVEYRNEAGWTQSKLAAVLTEIAGRQISRVTVANIEGSGRQQRIDVEMLFCLALAFDVAPADLCTADRGDAVVQIGARRNLSDNWRDFFRDGPPDPATQPTRENPGEVLALLAEELRATRDRGRRMALAVDVLGVAQGMLRAALMHQDRISQGKDSDDGEYQPAR